MKTIIIFFLIALTQKFGFCQLTATTSVLNNASCNNACNGEATVNVSNGTPPYTYLWNDPIAQTTATATNLCATHYSVTVSDANGDTLILNLTVPTLSGSYIDSIVIVQCTDTTSCNGSIKITTGGPQGTYSYGWSNGDSTNFISGLCPNAYTVSILDNAACIYDWTGIINYQLTTSIKNSDNHYDILTIYPNPFNSSTSIQYNSVINNGTLYFYNSLGQFVKQIKDISGQTTILHRGNLSNGLYFFRLTQDNKVITSDKLVITD